MNYKVAFSFADGKTFFCMASASESVLDAALRNGIRIPLDCREGVCGTCQGRCDTGSYSQAYVDEDALSEDDLAQGKVLACQTRVKSDAAFYFDFDSSLCSAEPTRQLDGTVIRVDKVSAGTAVLHLDVSASCNGVDYLPGQYARLLVPGTKHWRSYSFASAPGGSVLQFLIRLLPDGAMSNYIRERCGVGNRVSIEAPLGAFYLRQVTRPLIMVAGGTGLSAFLGMLDQMAATPPGQRVTLYYGVRYASDLCELHRLDEFTRVIPGFTYHLVVSEPEGGWEGKSGFIDKHLDVGAIAEVDHDIYLCGPPPMVESIKAWRVENDLMNSNLYFEKFTESNT